MPPPNLLVIHTDQQSSWSLGCYGGTLLETPHANRLAREGARLENFFTVSAVCTPSRGCFVTGRYPNAHGAYANNLPLHRDEVTFAEVLRRAGYATGYAGKWHLDGEPRPGWLRPERSMGFADCRFMFNRGHYKRIEERPGEAHPRPGNEIGDERTYTTDWLTEKTLDFLEAHRGTPFCFMLSIPDPHTPFSVRAPYDRMYAPEDMPLPPTYAEDPLPSWAAESRDASGYPLDMPHRERVLRERLAQYCGECKLIDDSLGRILTALERLEILDRTVVVFTTDHGEYMGEHGQLGKNHLYESAYRIPFLVRWPEQVPAGLTVRPFVTVVDFQPTILRLMGFDPCGREQGRDASPLLRGAQIAWTDEAHIHHDSHERAGIFTPEWELAFVKDREAILFDRTADPHQTNNRIGDPSCRPAIEALHARILAHHEALNSPAADWLERVTPC